MGGRNPNVKVFLPRFFRKILFPDTHSAAGPALVHTHSP